MRRNLVTAVVAILPFPIAYGIWSLQGAVRSPTGMSWLAFGEGQDSALGLLSALGSLGSALPYLVGACVASLSLGFASWTMMKDAR